MPKQPSKEERERLTPHELVDYQRKNMEWRADVMDEGIIMPIPRDVIIRGGVVHDYRCTPEQDKEHE